MPGFFETMSRMFKGEPVFKSEDSVTSDAPTITPDTRPAKVRSSRTDGKLAPVVVIDRIECDIEKSHMTLTAEIKNRHSEQIFLDKILILNNHYELDRDMRAGEEHTFRIYNGPRPVDTHLTRCELRYRNTAGDYFSAIHFVEFRKLQDGMYVVEQIRFLPPVKDI